MCLQDAQFRARMFRLFDANSDGILEFRDFCNGLAILQKGTKQEKLEFLFELFDLNGDKFIDKTEFTWLVTWQYKVMGFHDYDDMVSTAVDVAFTEFDVDHDGRLSFQEFQVVATKQPMLIQTFKLV